MRGGQGRPYRLYARSAAAAFFLVALFTLLVKVPGGELARDWTHTVLHVATGFLAVYAGWIARYATPAIVFTIAVAVLYGALGLLGWFTSGILMGSPFRIPLEAADNVFHLLLAGGAAATASVAGRRDRRQRA